MGAKTRDEDASQVNNVCLVFVILVICVVCLVFVILVICVVCLVFVILVICVVCLVFVMLVICIVCLVFVICVICIVCLVFVCLAAEIHKLWIWGAGCETVLPMTQWGDRAHLLV